MSTKFIVTHCKVTIYRHFVSEKIREKQRESDRKVESKENKRFQFECV